MKYTIMCYLVY